MKIIFLGTPDFIQPIKDILEKNFTLVESIDEADLGVVAAYGRILTKQELETPKYGFINVHPSLLPKYRGPSPIQATILNKDKETGVTIIKIDEKMDHGPVIFTKRIKLSGQENTLELSNKLFMLGAKILVKIIPDYVAGKIKLKPQNHKKATFCKMIKKEDGNFNIENLPKNLDRMIRAYFPWPTAWTTWNNKIVKFYPDGKIQMEGKKVIPIKDFLNGYPDFPLKI